MSSCEEQCAFLLWDWQKAKITYDGYTTTAVSPVMIGECGFESCYPLPRQYREQEVMIYGRESAQVSAETWDYISRSLTLHVTSVGRQTPR